MVTKIKIFILLAALFQQNCATRSPQTSVPPIGPGEPAAVIDTLPPTAAPIRVGAERMSEYLPMLTGRRVAMVVNHTSLIGATHLVDSLVSLGINIQKIFAPEHGFRGTADAGEKIAGGRDEATGIQVVSIYGAKKEPTKEDLADVDILLFDIQDVGVRFYTYISTLHYIMRAGARYGTPVLVLDRPNPNGHYIDGPILEPEYRSFVGLDPIPIVHGLTVAEYARMSNGEGWLGDDLKADLQVVTCENYRRDRPYDLPERPSPNLPNMRSIYLYPSVCFFEGTVANVGRGTTKQFQIFGHPDYPVKTFSYVPEPMFGARNPKLQGQRCYGVDLTDRSPESIRAEGRINLSYVIDFYNKFPNKDGFFLANKYFDTLAGTARLREQIREGWSEERIRATWQEGLDDYLERRRPYLLYP